MKFWDSSALVPLHVDETATKPLRQVLRDDPIVLVWMLSSVEVLSAIARLRRRSTGLDDVLGAVRREVLERWGQWSPVTHVEAVRRRAERLVAVHPLAAADAMQLAAALVASGDRPETLGFVTLDKRLATAAELEGFDVTYFSFTDTAALAARARHSADEHDLQLTNQHADQLDSEAKDVLGYRRS